MKLIIAAAFAMLPAPSALRANGDAAQTMKSAIATKFSEIQRREMYSADGRLVFPGGTLAVTLPSDETWTFAAGFEDVGKESPRRMATDCRMASGSVGKVFAGALATRLVVEGRLDPDSKISGFFASEPWFVDLPNGGDITVRHLLNHSSGLTSYYVDPRFIEHMRRKGDPSQPDHDPDFFASFAQLMSYATGRDALFPAGSKMSYSENAYLLLGAILGKIVVGDARAQEDVYRAAYYRGLKELILNPLGAAETTPFVGRKHDGLCQGYVGGHPALVGLHERMLDRGTLVIMPTSEFSGGGLVTSAADLARGMRGLTKGLVFATPDLQARFSSTFTTVGPADDRGSRHGFGPVVSDSAEVGRIIGHGGAFPGYRSIVMYFERFDLSVAMQVNSYADSGLSEYVKEIVALMVPMLQP